MIIAVTAVLVITTVAFVAAGFHFALRVTGMTPWSTEESLRHGLENGDYDEEFVASPKIDFEIDGVLGARINGFALPGVTGKTVVFCHGINSTRWGMAKYFDFFLRRGWTVVAYDHRGHGESTGTYPTYGLLEKEDLAKVMSWARGRFVDTETIGVFGESMGAATALQYAPMDPDLDFMVADCPFSSFDAEMYHQLGRRRIPRIFRRPILFIAYLRLKSLTGLGFRKASPEAAIARSAVPLLLFHGTADTYVPTAMSRRIYAVRKEIGPTELHLVEGAAHAESIRVDKKSYERALEDFLALRVQG